MGSPLSITLANIFFQKIHKLIINIIKNYDAARIMWMMDYALQRTIRSTENIATKN